MSWQHKAAIIELIGRRSRFHTNHRADIALSGSSITISERVFKQEYEALSALTWVVYLPFMLRVGNEVFNILFSHAVYMLGLE